MRPEAGEGVRAFVALDVSTHLREQLVDLESRLRAGSGGLRWVRPEAIHLTLRFLGHSRPAALESLGVRLSRAARACPPATAAVTGLGVFPERGSPRVLWVGLDLPGTMRKLQQECERAAVEAGFPREPRPFRPHLTLGRWRGAAPRPVLPEVALDPTPLDTLVLYRSELGPGGAVYTALSRFALGGS